MTVNRLIKKAGKKAGLTSPFKLVTGNENNRETRVVPKYQILSTKVARNSFIVHALKLGISAQAIMQVTGLKTLPVINKFLPSASADIEREWVKFDQIGQSD